MLLKRMACLCGWLRGLLLCLKVAAQRTDDPVVLSPRVGPVIDSEERGYFQLLPDYEPFVAARAFAGEGGGGRLVIERAGASDAVLTLNRPNKEALMTYLDEYESMTPDRVRAALGPTGDRGRRLHGRRAHPGCLNGLARLSYSRSRVG